MRRSSARVIAGLVLGAVVLFGTVGLPSLRAAICDAATLSARQQLAAWIRLPSEPVQWDAWLVVRRSLAEASEHCVDVSLYPMELAKLHALRGAQAGQATAVRDLFYRKANDYFRAALNNRPFSATTLANLAQFKAYLHEFDAEYHRTLFLSIQLGQNDPDVQLAALNAGLMGWARLSSSEKQRLIVLYGSAITQQPYAAKQLALAYPAVVID